jgi:integrase
MATLRLKGLNHATKRLRDGRVVTHWYAWRNGPKLEGRYGTPEFIASYMKACEARQTSAGDTLKDLIERYERAPEFTRLAKSTRDERLRWHKRIIASKLSTMPRRLLNDPRAKTLMLDWRDTFAAASPRNADYAVQSLSAALGWGHGRGLLTVNILAGVRMMYRSDRADQVWTADEIECFGRHCTIQTFQALRLACLTGLRRSDLIALTWGEVGDAAILRVTDKGQGRVRVTVPLIDETLELLAEIGRKAPGVTVLLNTRGRAWSGDGLENRIIKAKKAAGINKHLHDARGTFATRLRHATFTSSEIADIMGWSAERVERILAHYVDRDEIVLRLAARLNERRTKLQTVLKPAGPE